MQAGWRAMMLPFTKMNGAGNDFILIDNRQGAIHLDEAQVRHLCHRQRGIGADGIMLLIPARNGKAEWAWDFYNSDGSHAEMCGNGARCFARFIQRVTGAKDSTSFETAAGVIQTRIQGERVTVTLTPPRNFRLNESISLKQGAVTVHSVDTGVPHAVLFVPDADQAMVHPMGNEIRFHPHFKPRGTNVNFVQVLGPNSIRVRTYERGVEGETLACGTGVTAAALVSSAVHSFTAPIQVRVQGGDLLEIGFERAGNEFRDVTLTGPADFSFEGTANV